MLAASLPPGIYYLTEYVAITTRNGVYGKEIGTHVTLVEDFGDHLRVKLGDDEFDVKPNQVTNDFEIAMRAWGNRGCPATTTSRSTAAASGTGAPAPNCTSR